MIEISHKKFECIGCDACVDIAPNYWFMDEDGLAQLHSVTRVVGNFEYGECFADDLELLKASMEACPVDIILVK